MTASDELDELFAGPDSEVDDPFNVSPTPAVDDESRPVPSASEDEGAAAGDDSEVTGSSPDPEAAKDDTEPVPPASELEALRARVEQLTADLRRERAEFINYRTRADRERKAAQDVAVVAVIRPLLPVLDSIDAAEQVGELTGGFAAVTDALIETLERAGLARFGAEGEAFDPRYHEAIANLPLEGTTEPVCLDVAQPGYWFNTTLLRPAQVAVAVAPKP